MTPLVFGALLILPPAVRAECDGPFPSFRAAAPHARQIVIGEVVAAGGEPVKEDGRTSHFLLRGWSVLEGSRPVELEIKDLPTQPCAGVVAARPGDQIAIAFEGKDFAQIVNAVAWLSGGRPKLVGIESITYPEVYSLAGLPAPATLPGTANDDTDDVDSVPIVRGLILALVAGIAALAVVVRWSVLSRKPS